MTSEENASYFVGVMLALANLVEHLDRAGAIDGAAYARSLRLSSQNNSEGAAAIMREIADRVNYEQEASQIVPPLHSVD